MRLDNRPLHNTETKGPGGHYHFRDLTHFILWLEKVADTYSSVKTRSLQPIKRSGGGSEGTGGGSWGFYFLSKVFPVPNYFWLPEVVGEELWETWPRSGAYNRHVSLGWGGLLKLIRKLYTEQWKAAIEYWEYHQHAEEKERWGAELKDALINLVEFTKVTLDTGRKLGYTVSEIEGLLEEATKRGHENDNDN